VFLVFVISEIEMRNIKKTNMQGHAKGLQKASVLDFYLNSFFLLIKLTKNKFKKYKLKSENIIVFEMKFDFLFEYN